MSLLLKTHEFTSANTVDVALNCGGLFQEAAEDSLAVDKTFDVRMMKLDSFTEAVDRELEINIAKAELKCMMEDGTDDDQAYLESAAEEGAIGKLKKMIDAVIAAWKEWISQKKTKVISKICSAEARAVLSKAEKRAKINPFLSKKKVEIMDGKRPLGVIRTYKAKNDKILAKTVKGIVTESTMKTVADTKESFREDFKNAIAGKAGVTTITVAALLAQLNSDIGKLPSYVDKMESSTSQALERLKASCTEEAAAAATAATNAAANFGAELAKEEVNVMVDSIMNKMSVLKSEVLHAKDTEVKPVKPIKESADTEIEELGSAFEEATSEFDDIEVTESAEDSEFGDDEHFFSESAEDPDDDGFNAMMASLFSDSEAEFL